VFDPQKRHQALSFAFSFVLSPHDKLGETGGHEYSSTFFAVENVA
jgi:hypothetical protein